MGEPHRNMMTAWDEIRCLRDCAEHHTQEVHVEIGGPTAYADQPPIPERFRRSFRMEVWDPDRHPVDDGPYCPAHDAVSETIARLGVWEPAETVITLDLLSTGERRGLVDIGAQLGWYSLLARTCGQPVLAVEADADNHALLQSNLRNLRQPLPVGGSVPMQAEVGLTEKGVELMSLHWRVGSPPAPPPPEQARLVKIDVEGAEPEAVDWLWPSIGRIDALLIELSPCFHDGYPKLAESLCYAGYDAYRMPHRVPRPSPLCAEPGRLIADLEDANCRIRGDVVAPFVAGRHQINMLFIRPERYP